MEEDIIIHPAKALDIPRLRATMVQECSPEAGRILDAHLVRPRYQPGFTWIAEREGEIAGWILFAHQRLRIGNAIIDIGRLEHAYVWSDYEDLSTFEALIGACMGNMIDNGMTLATLDSSEAIFPASGFAPYCMRSEIRLPGALPAAPTLRPAVEMDLNDLAALYDATYMGLPFAEDRAAPDWRIWLATSHMVLVLEDASGRVCAYAARTAYNLNHASLDEAAAADAGAARVLLAGLSVLSNAKVILKLSPQHIVGRTALHLGATALIKADSADEGPGRAAHLAGVIDLSALLIAPAPELERRLAGSRYAGWSGNLRIELASERVTLALSEGHATVIDGTRPADVRLRQVQLPAVVQLLLGYRSAADLRATGELGCDDTSLGLIDTLFPLL